ncbi:MBL fold metallo-hydrolase [Roseomonas sp. CCTCC AB2023176]|uniref:MBL fold metallo-hydrolase n=1 Tax=Roseomonas sp. CCTCC AB2023176 TaxID=3342640 RepID=UPI0035DB9B23
MPTPPGRRAALALLAAPALLRAVPASAQTSTAPAPASPAPASPAPASPAPASPATASPAPLNQAPGFFRTRVGALTVTMIHDGSRPIPLQGFVRNAPIEEVQRVLAESYLPTDSFRIPFTLTCVETPRGIVLFDSGNGAQAPGSPVGLATANMRAAGIDPARINTVVISHFHGDHISGLTTADGAAVFPNAEIIVPEAEWRFWTDASNEARSPEGQRANFANTTRRFAPYQGKVRQVADGAEIVPGIRAVAAYGHTPGHTAWHVSDGADQMMYLADVTNRPELFARRPGFHAVFDFDANAAEATRRRTFDRVATDRIRVTGYHFPFPATGFVAKDGDGYRFVPADWAAAT